MTEGEENIIIKGVLLEAISRELMDFLKAMNFKRWQLPFYRLIEKIWRIV